MVQEFHVLRCFSCEVFQIQQVKKVNKWSCKVCGQKQSVLKEFGRGSGADCRRHVQKLNAARGAKMEEDAEHRAKMEEDTEHRAKMEEDAEHRAKMDAQSLWSEADEDEEEKLLNKPVSRWDKYLPATREGAGLTPEEGAEPEESAVVMDRELLRIPKPEQNSSLPLKRKRTEQDLDSGPDSSSRAPPRCPSPRSGPRAVSKWSTFLDKPPNPGATAAALFQSEEDLDLSWTEDWT